jgi:hypothetical protein
MVANTPDPDATPDGTAASATPVNETGEVAATNPYVIITDADAPKSGTGEVETVAVPAASAPAYEQPVEVETPTTDPATVAPVAVAPVAVAPATTPLATAPIASPPAPEPQIVYVTAPHPPKKEGNRGAGVAIAALSSAVYAVLLAVVVIALFQWLKPGTSLEVLAQLGFYVPVIFFAIGFIVLVLIVNRGGWWAYIVGSVIVALFVYFGATGYILLTQGILVDTPDIAAAKYSVALTSPVVIASALLAREVALWGGAIISRIGKRVKDRNVETRAKFDAEQAELKR